MPVIPHRIRYAVECIHYNKKKCLKKKFLWMYLNCDNYISSLDPPSKNFTSYCKNFKENYNHKFLGIRTSPKFIPHKFHICSDDYKFKY